MLKALRIPKDLFQHILLVLLLEIFLFLGLAIGNIWNGSEAIAAPVKPTLVAYDIDKEIDRQRKEATQEHYGEDAGKVVNEALANNEESSNSNIKSSKTSL